jgi:1,4-alpha-glucan branching enzyme
LREKIPDPQAETTFASARLDWSACARAPHAAVLDWYRRILTVRRQTITPLLDSITRGGTWRELGPSAVAVRWQAGPGRVLSLLANLSDRRVGGVAPSKGQTLWQEGDALAGDTLGAWAIRWDLETTAA